MGDLSNFERGEIVDACLAGESVTKTATLLSVSRATVSEVTAAYMNQEKTTSVKRKSVQKINTDRKRSSYIEKDYLKKITELLQHR
jgi:hypothetical protein